MRLLGFRIRICNKRETDRFFYLSYLSHDRHDVFISLYTMRGLFRRFFPLVHTWNDYLPAPEIKRTERTTVRVMVCIGVWCGDVFRVCVGILRG